MAPLILKAQDKAGTRAPVLGEGDFKYEAIHDWGELPSHIKWGNTHNVVEDAQGHIHVHHTVHATSESGDTVVVFDRAGKFVRSWGQEFRGVAHGLWIQKEGSEEFLYLTVNAANARMQPPPTLPATVVKATLKGEIVYKIQGPPDIAEYKAPRRTRRRHRRRYNPTNIAIAPNGDLYVGGRLRFVLHQSLRPHGQVPEHVRRPRIRRRPDEGAARDLDRHARRDAERHGRRPPQQPAAAIHAGRRAHRLRRGLPPALPLPRAQRRRRHCRSAGAGHADGSEQPHHRASRRRHAGVAAESEPRATGTARAFVPGQFITPHGANFDHDGNIFVVEWVEIGRVTKLRKVS